MELSLCKIVNHKWISTIIRESIHLIWKCGNHMGGCCRSCGAFCICYWDTYDGMKLQMCRECFTMWVLYKNRKPPKIGTIPSSINNILISETKAMSCTWCYKRTNSYVMQVNLLNKWGTVLYICIGCLGSGLC
jgi:hypothetical protein